jgi:hypothetical protein
MNFGAHEIFPSDWVRTGSGHAWLLQASKKYRAESENRFAGANAGQVTIKVADILHVQTDHHRKSARGTPLEVA